jgi:hypothetical protein
MTLGIGAVVTLAALAATVLENAFGLAVALLSATAGPLLAVFLLGILTRRATGPAARTAFVVGTSLALALTSVHHFDALRARWPLPVMAETWTLTGSVLFTFVAGYLLSFVLGRVKSKEELRGLAVGCGKLGIRQRETPQLRLPQPR